ncbi:hypothetical protein [Streptomyces sp. NPDC048659]|uniref:hypothetical protein n=1 Tax=Streptomyces sp. NPDC048659 TaxID=3155489 RepID=UPI0034133405
MSRTAHHVPPRHAPVAGDRPGRPWHALVLYDLRHGGGSAPRAVRRSVAVYAFARHNRDRALGREATVAERRARQRLRARLGTVVRLVDSPAGRLSPEAADAVDVPPARHRRGVLWLA